MAGSPYARSCGRESARSSSSSHPRARSPPSSASGCPRPPASDRPRATVERSCTHGGAPGRRRLLRALPLCRCPRARRRREPTAGVPRPGHRPAQSRRGHSQRRGANGIVITERNAARVTAAVCKASAGAVEHLPVAVVVNLARYLEEIKGPQLWVWAADGGAEISASGLRHRRRAGVGAEERLRPACWSGTMLQRSAGRPCRLAERQRCRGRRALRARQRGGRGEAAVTDATDGHP